MTEISLLIVEDDQVFAETLKTSFERRGYSVWHVVGYDKLLPVLDEFTPQCAVVDLKLVGRSGLDCVREIHGRYPQARIVVLTGFASIGTAVEAIKLGAPLSPETGKH